MSQALSLGCLQPPFFKPLKDTIKENVKQTLQKSTMMSDILTIDWELPSKISSPDMRTWIWTTPSLTLRDHCVYFGLNDTEVLRLHRVMGQELIEWVVKAFESPTNSYKQENMTFIISENCLTCLYRNKSPSYVSTLRSVLSWFALANRLPIPQKIGLSKGAWQGNHFRLRPLEEIMWPRQTCWVKIFKTAVIASMQESIPPDPFLHTTFLLARQITAVQTPLHVDAGIMWHGSFCSLVPVQVLANSAILWHFEASDNDDVLQLKDIGALQGPWFQTMDLGVHYSAPAVIGWCPAGLIRLATDQSLVSRNIWASGVRTEMYSVTYQVQLSCQPVPQFGITGLLAFQRDDPQCRQVETANYLKLIDSSQKRFVILYDVTSKRGWLLPEVVALHHLVLHAQRWLSYSQSPLAAPSVDGRDSSFILRKHANHILTQNGNVRYRLKNLVTDIASNLRRIEPIPSPHNLIGFQMMDIANGDPHKLHPMTVNMRPRPSWMAFTQHLPCLLASNLGDAITGNRSQMANAGCNFLKAGRNYLAATEKAGKCPGGNSGTRLNATFGPAATKVVATVGSKWNSFRTLTQTHAPTHQVPSRYLMAVSWCLGVVIGGAGGQELFSSGCKEPGYGHRDVYSTMVIFDFYRRRFEVWR